MPWTPTYTLELTLDSTIASIINTVPSRRHTCPVYTVTTQKSLLHVNLHPSLATRRALHSAKLRKKISNIIPRMPIKPGTQTLLVKIMRNQADTPAEYE